MLHTAIKHTCPAFSRGVRTRPQIKLQNPNQKQKLVATPPSSSSSSSSLSSTSTASTPLRHRSKFNKDTQQIIDQLQFKPRKQIEQELTSKFASDGLDVDTEFIARLVDKAESEKKLVESYVNDPKSTLTELKREEINAFIDWLVQDGQTKLQNERENNGSKREELNEFLTDESFDQSDPEQLTKAFTDAQQLAMNESLSQSIKQLPIFLRHLNKLSNIDIRNQIELAKYVSIYELSVQITTKDRDLCIYLSGKLLYDALVKEFGPNARPDPINEMFFIESCLVFKDFNRANDLWISRRDKDVKEYRFWKELGINVRLAQYADSQDKALIDECVELINQLREDVAKWNGLDTKILIQGVRTCFENNNFEDAVWFWEEVLVNVDQEGVTKINEGDDFMDTIFYTDEKKFNDVVQFYNRNRPVVWDQLMSCVFAAISKMKFTAATEMLLALNFEEFDAFMVYFVEKLRDNFSYPGLEMFLHNLELMPKAKENEEILTFLIDQLGASQNVRCESIEEAKLLEDINIFLNRLSVFKTKDSAKIDDLQDIIRNGDRLTLFDIKVLLKLLLNNNSKTSFQLACKLLNQMNANKAAQKIGMFPMADASSYAAIIRRLLVQSNPRISELSYFLDMMAEYNIKLNEKLANMIIMSFVTKKMFNEALRFVQTYIFSDNPIAITNIDNKIVNVGKNVYTASLLAYSKLAVTGGLDSQSFNHILTSLRCFIKNLMDQQLDDEFTTQEVIGTLLNYGDYQSAICVIQWYGSILNKQSINFDFVLAIKSKLELSLNKAEKYVASSNDLQFQNRLETYKLYFGVNSLINDFKEKPSFPWQEVALVLYKYADLFGYKSVFTKHDPFSLLMSDFDRNANRIKFDNDLKDLQDFYGLSRWNPSV